MADTRKRFARRQWARRWLTWKYIVGSVVVLGLLIGSVYTVYFSSALRVEGVKVKGAESLSEKHIEAVAKVPTGGPLATLDVDQIAYRVGALAEVKSVDVVREWPHDVRIEVTERTPIAVVDIAGQLHSLDETGAVFGDYKKAPPGLPRVLTSGSADADALAEAAKVVAALDDELAPIVDHVEVRTVDQIALALKDGRTVQWGSSEESSVKAEVLAGLLTEKATEYDVSVPGAPTLR